MLTIWETEAPDVITHTLYEYIHLTLRKDTSTLLAGALLKAAK